ncbi:MAG: glycosyltransferase [Acidothermus sp.]|nr:glycosyltransferase [Acidothermus sp.]
MTRQPKTSIIIAAHDEEQVIGRGLAALLGDAVPGEFQVLVVCNGCRDATAAAARSAGEELGHHIQVIEIPVASKIAALRAAENEADVRAADVRIYVDADVEVSTETARKLRDAVLGDGPRLGVVRPLVRAEQASWPVRAYFAVWNERRSLDSDGSGTGVFAVNAAGVSRIADWPAVMNDDGFVVRQFSDAEKVLVDAVSLIHPPRTLGALIRRRARVVNGNRELDLRWPRVGGLQGSSTSSADRKSSHLGRLRFSPVHLAVFLSVTAAARLLAAWRRWRGRGGEWSVDTTSRRVSDVAS